MTSAAIRLLKPRSHHLHSLGAFNKTLPEFSDASVKASNLIDEAFKSSFIDEVSDLRYWKNFKSRFLQKPLHLTPRETARLKYALSYRGKEAVRYANWGKAELHNHLVKECESKVASMTAVELLSSLYGFRSLENEKLYEALFSALKKEIRSTKELDLLAVAPYVVSHSAINTRYLDPRRPKQITSERNFEMLEIVQELITDRITECSDDQIAVLCAGLSNSEVHPERKLQLKYLIDGLETDILNRRIERMSGSNLVDVARCFSKLNWGPDQLFEGVQKQAKDKFSTLSIDEVVDLSYSLSCRESMEKSIQTQAETRMLKELSDVRENFFSKVALYLFINLSTNTDLLKAVVNRVEQGKGVPITRYYSFSKLHFFLDAKFPDLVSAKYVENLEANAILFRASRMMNHPRFQLAAFQSTAAALARLGLKLATGYPYENVGVIDFGLMPQKIGINLALPHYDLLGKYEPDDRLVKTTKRVFRASKECYARGELFRLKGWKVLDWNAHDLAENLDSHEARKAFMLQSLATVGVQPSASPHA